VTGFHSYNGSNESTVVVIGGGFGGLSTACYLADAGLNVSVLEQNEQLGGRASRLHAEGFRFDMGPSWYLMPDVFERFFEDFDRQPSDYYDLTHLDPHYRVFWKDGDRVDVTSDHEAMRATFESYEDGAGDAFDRYLERAAETYDIGMEHFVYTDRPRFRDYLDWDVFRNARGLSLLKSMDQHVAQYFDHPKLRQLVQYSLVFLGGAPWNTPALYNLMSHVDNGLGVYYPDGGIGSVVDALVTLGNELGVTYHTGVAVTEITGGRGGFELETEPRGDTDHRWNQTLSGQESVSSPFFLSEPVSDRGNPTSSHPNGAVEADIVVSDADYAHTEQSLLEPADRQYDEEYWDTRTYSPSAFLLYLGVEGSVDPLAHHTLVIPTDWDDHFEAIFDRPAWPEDPAYYCCVPSRTDTSVSPEGQSALFLLVPIAPGLEDDAATRQRYRDEILQDLAENTGVNLQSRIVFEEQFSISEFTSRYNSREGTALGLAHTLRQTGPLRPNRRSKALDGLYFTGSYTTPGIGVPMCLISGEHTAKAVCADIGVKN
jgi:phytoene desaturase